MKPLIEGFFQLLVLGPFAWMARKTLKRINTRYFFVFCFLFLLDGIVVYGLKFSLFSSQQWNWVGKSGSLLWSTVFLYTTKLLTKNDTGWTLKINNRKTVFQIVAVCLMIRLAIRLFYQGYPGGYDLETFCYEATMPGIVEEIVFRGILLGLLNNAFILKWKLLKTPFGWGLILTSILFGLFHGLSIDESWRPDFNSQKFVMTGAMGFAFGFVKEKSGSLVPAILFHNLWNIIAYWG